ncbi:alpha-amylase family protein [Nakamurella flavida]|uniref:Alpha-amylase family protein n=1 Tax=Nakamurella flavida TaxID=363630 RepID=A0A938YL68_9ACTN|nr:alpha-amylase family protein [Nakamurella flavida]MBM9477204.1 alpha-amylase family protein [Nakamurella flavida]MDP9780153.1 amylosucrase [Nakamurella flavida]
MRCAPGDLHDLAAEVLTDSPAHERQLFDLRLDRWFADLHDGLAAVFPAAAVGPLERRLIGTAARAFADRDPELKELDLRRTLDDAWICDPGMIGYATYADRFAGTLAGLGDRLDYLSELGVSYLHLMPLLEPRPGDSDGGYAVADYRRVRADLGDTGDLRALATALRGRGISLVLDLVLNHVAEEHAWAAAARAGDAHYQDYFRLYPDRAEPDAFERTLPEVFPDFAPGNFTWNAEMQRWVWTTFNAFQWDLNWANPDVLVEFAEIILFLANLGVEVVRLDAIAFLWKRLGTNCQNQPEVHALTQALRAVSRIACPALAFKAEAIVGPTDLVHYLGRGVHHGKVSDIAYHNSLMVQIWSMLAAQDVRLAAHALRAIPPIPASTTWVTYVRCHDDIGWAIDDADAAAVGLTGWGHRAFLSDYYSGSFPGSPARGLVFQENPATGDRRISGTAASLCGLDVALQAGPVPGRVGAGLVDAALARVLLGYAMVFGWGGIPVIWMGDELGLRNDPDWASEPGHEEDNRWAHRPRMPWDVAEERQDGATVAGRMFTALRHFATVRASLPYLDATVEAEIPELADPGILPVLRRHPVGVMLQLYNVTAGWRPWPGHLLHAHGLADGVDALSGTLVQIGLDGNLWLAPHASLWIVPRG